MAYEVTATRKRPQTFDQMAGQDFVVTTLKASVKSGRIAHAYLFSGPRGIGKTSAARILARSLNCIKGPSEIPCGECENCTEISRGNSLDVIEIDGASNTSVNDVREIKDEVLFSPNASRYKIYIIDEVHMLSNSAFNALLKTIEEPPPYVVFIFATTEIHKVPATVRSRCQQFNFRLISMDVIKGLLSEAVAEMDLEAEDDALFWIAKEATGSLRDAYTLFDQIASFADSRITMDLIGEKLGLVGLDRINRLAEFLVSNNAKSAIELADEILTYGVSVEQFVIDLAEFFRCVLFIKHGVHKESLIGYGVDQFSQKVLEGFSDVQVEKALNLVLSLYRELRYSLNQRYELELTLSRLSVLSSYIHPRDLLKKIDELRAETSATGLQTSAAPAQEPQSAQLDMLAGGDKAVGSKTPPRLDADDQSGADDLQLLSSDSKAPSGNPQSEMPNPTDNDSSHMPRQSSSDSESEQKEVLRDLTDAEKESVMEPLRIKHLSLASSLEKSSTWRISGNTIEITCQTSYDAVNIRREQQKLIELMDGALGKSYAIRVIPEQNDRLESDTDSNEKIEMIRRVFRGEIVNE